MSRETFDRLRLPLGLGLALLLLAGYMLIRRADADSVAVDPGPSVVVGEPGGGVVTSSSSAEPTPTATATPAATPTPAPTPTPTPTVVPTPAPVANFVAEVLACRRIDGPECVDRLRRIRPNDENFVALVLFDNAIQGDVLNAILDGPSGQIEGGAYTLPGSGRGYYYSTFAVSELPQGRYTLTALRNGSPVASIELQKDDGGGDDD